MDTAVHYSAVERGRVYTTSRIYSMSDDMVTTVCILMGTVNRVWINRTNVFMLKYKIDVHGSGHHGWPSRQVHMHFSIAKSQESRGVSARRQAGQHNQLRLWRNPVAVVPFPFYPGPIMRAAVTPKPSRSDIHMPNLIDRFFFKFWNAAYAVHGLDWIGSASRHARTRLAARESERFHQNRHLSARERELDRSPFSHPRVDLSSQHGRILLRFCLYFFVGFCAPRHKSVFPIPHQISHIQPVWFVQWCCDAELGSDASVFRVAAAATYSS
jgi:hypothetical protein